MRVLNILIDIRKIWGGPVRSVGDLVRIQRDLGMTPVVLGVDRGGEVALFEGAESVIRCAPSFPGRFSNSNAAIAWLKANIETFDLVIVNEVWSVMVQRALALLRRRGVPYILQPRGSLDPYDLRKKASFKALLGRLVVAPNLAGARCILAASAVEKERLNTFGASVPVEVLPHAISPLPPGKRSTLRDRLGFGARDVVFLSISRFDPKKRLDLLLQAFVGTRKLVPNARLLIAGDGPSAHKKALKAMAAASPCAGDISFLGFLDGTGKQDALAAADIFVLPSDFENFGVAVVEAMHAGLPLILSTGVQIWKDVVESGAGIVFDGTAKDLRDGMASLASDENRRRLMGRHAATLAEAYSPEKLSAAYLSLWRRQQAPFFSMEMPAKIVVIIASARRPAVLHETVVNLKNQTRQADEILISIPEEGIHCMPETRQLPNVRVIEGPKGRAVQRNTAIDLAPEGALLIFLDDDVELHPGYFERCGKVMAEHPESVAMGGLVLADGSNRPEEIPRSQAIALLRDTNPPAARLGQRSSLYGCNAVVRREVARLVRFDNDLIGYPIFDDRDFGNRCRRYGSILDSTECRIVHLATRSGRVSPVHFGIAQIITPVHCWRKGSFQGIETIRLICNCVAGNLLGLVIRHKGKRRRDRIGQCMGNIIGVLKVMKTIVSPV